MKNKLREILYDQRVTVTQLSRETGIPRPSIYNIMNNGSSIKTESLLAICEALHISPNDFYGWKERKKHGKEKS